MAAGTAYGKRYAGGFADGSAGATPIDSTFLNAVEAALLQLYGSAPSADGQVPVWVDASTKFGFAKILNANVDPAAAIAKSKLDFTGGNGIVNADVAGAAAIARSKLDFGSGLVNADIAAGAAIAMSKIAGLGLYRKTTVKAVNTTVAATDLLNGEITIAANAIGATGVLRLSAFGDWLNNSGGSIAPPRLQLVLGATTLLDTGVGGMSFGASATRFAWNLEATIVNMGAANSQTAKLNLLIGTNLASAASAAFTTGNGIYRYYDVGANVVSNAGAQGVNTSAVDTTASNALVLNVINGSANASAETKLFSALVEIL